MPDEPIELSYLIVNTDGGELLHRCVDAITQTCPLEPSRREVIVLDNASTDGSAQRLEERHGEVVQVVHQRLRSGKALNDTFLLELARGRFAMLLNEDSELLDGASAALLAALQATPGAAAAGAQLLDPEGRPQPCAWRFPTLPTALAGAVFAHRRFTVQSGGGERREVDWVQSAAMLVRHAAFREVGGLDPRFFVYSDEVDWQRRLRDAGWSILYEPDAHAIHHEQLRHDADFSRARIVEFSRNRDRYLRKHHGWPIALAARGLTAWAYGLRAVAATVLPGHSARRFAFHVRATLVPAHSGPGLAEKADAFNRSLPYA
ncbi:MAG: glycosyltransferase family 2 protein [Solirubrobacterales bacterium]